MSANWKNVNNWHWVERCCKNVFSDKFHEIFRLKNSSNHQKIYKIKSIQGDVSISQRKGRIKLIHDLTIEFLWKNSDREGTVTLKDFISGSEQDDLELIFSPLIEDAKLKKEIILEVKNSIYDGIISTLSKVKEEEGSKLTVTDKSQNIEQSSDNLQKTNNGLEKVNLSQSMNNLPKTSLEDVSSKQIKKTLNLEEGFMIEPEKIYRALIDQDILKIWTRDPSVASSPIEQGTFSILGGRIKGMYKSLVPNERIKMEWHDQNWIKASSDEDNSIEIKNEDYSLVSIELSKDGNNTKLKLNQKGIPTDKYGETANIWRSFYFNTIKSSVAYIL
eukprot:GHVP01005967.1.p2 GENE.GHVP01005967.1~~GHVP01005967.1.p2  ORF type:complete len:332 (+),score=60.95 GHVP01005967.1:180-1175(+)